MQSLLPSTPPPPPPATPPSRRRARAEPPIVSQPWDNGAGLQFQNRSPTTTFSLEIDESSTKSGGPSWASRIPWLRNKDQHGDNSSYIEHAGGDGLFRGYNGMGAEGDNLTLLPTLSTQSTSSSGHISRPGFFSDSRRIPTRTPSILSKASSGASVDSHDVEWTPPDSAYGAACPVCGCLPKQIRRGIELGLVVILVVILVYVVVTTSIRITKASGGNNVSNSGNFQLDDDFFIENYDDLYRNATDDANDDEFDGEDEDGAGRWLSFEQLFR